MPQPTYLNCGNCRFMIDNYKDGKPRCHRYPPQAKDEVEYSRTLGQRVVDHYWRFPEVKKADWCGEWQPIAESGNPSE